VEGAPEASDQLSKLGFDPFTDMPPLGAFSELLARRARAKLKAVLLDQVSRGGLPSNARGGVGESRACGKAW
jgi:formamidopyrimidine-DNA glycosylase